MSVRAVVTVQIPDVGEGYVSAPDVTLRVVAQALQRAGVTHRGCAQLVLLLHDDGTLERATPDDAVTLYRPARSKSPSAALGDFAGEQLALELEDRDGA
jgi:hypothetical protein